MSSFGCPSDDPSDLNPETSADPRPSINKVKGCKGAQDDSDDKSDDNPVGVGNIGGAGAGDGEDKNDDNQFGNIGDVDGAGDGNFGGDGAGADVGDVDSKDVKPTVLNIDESATGCGDLDEYDEVNPFLLNEVIQVLVTQMSIEDLKKCRRVSSLWNQAASADLHKLSPLLKPQKFADAEKVENFTKLLRNSPNRQLIAYSTQVENLSDISSNGHDFLQLFEPKNLEINVGEIYMDELIEFFQKCGNFVKSLKIEGCLIIGGEISWPDLKFSQLEELKLGIRSIKMEPLPQVVQDENFILENVIKNSPQLKNIDLGRGQSEQHLAILRNSDGRFDLQELDIAVVSDESRFNIVDIPERLIQMSSMGLRLKKFKLNFVVGEDNNDPYPIPDDDVEDEGEDDDDNEDDDDDNDEVDHFQTQQIRSFFEKLSQFLSSQSETLESLIISMIYFGSAAYNPRMPTIGKVKIPQMNQLKVLTIRNWIGNAVLVYDQMDLPGFPKLKELELQMLYVSDWDSIFSGVSESLEKLTINHISYNDLKGDAEYRELGFYFPKVKCLSIESVIEDLYREVLEEFPWETTLTRLILTLSELGDLKLGSLMYLKELRKLEVHRQENGDVDSDDELDEEEDPINNNINLKKLSKTSVKYLKLKNFLISPVLESQIREKYVLDYTPDLKN